MVLRSEIREMGGIIVAYGKGIGVRWCGRNYPGLPESWGATLRDSVTAPPTEVAFPVDGSYLGRGRSSRVWVHELAPFEGFKELAHPLPSPSFLPDGNFPKASLVPPLAADLVGPPARAVTV